MTWDEVGARLETLLAPDDRRHGPMVIGITVALPF
jgi:hypothetical protein